MNILIIPEDPTNDHYILDPLFKRLFQSFGKGRVHVRVCWDPVLGGVDEALKSQRLKEIIDRYDGMTDIFILCVDRDGNTQRRTRLNQIEHEFGDDGERNFVATNAWEEIETWVLAGVDLPSNWKWREVRAEINVKEIYFNRLAKQLDLATSPGRGRKILGEKAARKITAIRSKCPEDLDELALRLERIVN